MCFIYVCVCVCEWVGVCMGAPMVSYLYNELSYYMGVHSRIYPICKIFVLYIYITGSNNY